MSWQLASNAFLAALGMIDLPSPALPPPLMITVSLLVRKPIAEAVARLSNSRHDRFSTHSRHRNLV